MAIPASIDNDVPRHRPVDRRRYRAEYDRRRGRPAARHGVARTTGAFLVETMGRNCGYLALVAGVVCGAGARARARKLPADRRRRARRRSGSAHDRGKGNAIIIVAEGAPVGIGEVMKALEATDVGFADRPRSRAAGPRPARRLAERVRPAACASRMGAGRVVEALLAGRGERSRTASTGSATAVPRPGCRVVGQVPRPAWNSPR